MDLPPAPVGDEGLGPVCSWAVAEVRLAAGDPRVDVAVAVGPGEAARRALVDHPDRLLRAWGRGEGPLAGVGYLWREHDAGADRPSVVYAEVEGEAADPVAVAAALGHRPFAPQAAAALRRAVARLPPGATVVHVGDLRPRGLEAARLVVRVPRDRLGDWLAASGWTGARPALEATLAALAHHHSHVGVQLDLAETPLPRLGVELHHPTVGGVDPRWTTLVDRLVDLGLADPPRALAFLGWACALAAPPAAVGAQVKVDLAPDGAATAKGYLAWAARA